MLILMHIISLFSQIGDSLMALYVFTYVFILSQTSCIWYIFLDGFFFCTIASSSPGMAINGPQMGMVVNVEIFILAISEKEHFINILHCF